MAVFLGNFTPNSTTPEQFRAWGSYMRDAMAAVGLVQTADTGQINWATVTWTGNPTGQTMFGYEIWRFNDTLQGAAPLFLKVEYGCGPNYTLPGYAITLGKGTDGAGTISTAKIIAPRTQYSIMTAASGAVPLYMFCDGSAFAFFAGPGLSAPTWTFFVERSRDSTGVPTASGVAVANQNNAGCLWWCYNYSTPLAFAYWTTPGPVNLPSNISGQPVQSSSVAASATVSAPAILIPVYAPGVAPWVLQTLVVVPPGDAGAGTQMNVIVNGASRVYRSIPCADGYGLMRLNPMIWWS